MHHNDNNNLVYTIIYSNSMVLPLNRQSEKGEGQVICRWASLLHWKFHQRSIFFNLQSPSGREGTTNNAWQNDIAQLIGKYLIP